MFKILRVIFAVGAAVLIALCVFAGILWDMIAVWACLGGALLFFALSMLFKFLQEEREKKSRSPILRTAPRLPATRTKRRRRNGKQTRIKTQTTKTICANKFFTKRADGMSAVRSLFLYII